jgi:hypothetical protein
MMLPQMPAGVPVTFTLGPFDALQLHTLFDVASDLTGSLITSTAPVAVFGGSRCTRVPGGWRACEHVEEQSRPVAAWGSDYLLVKSPPRGVASDTWRILAREDGTRLTLDPNPFGGGTIPLEAGRFIDITTTDDLHATANHPISVGQFLVSEGFRATIGDPSLVLMLPTTQFPVSHLFLTPPGWREDYVTIVRPADAAVLLDGSPVPDAAFVALGVTGFERAWIPLADGAHRVEATGGVGAYAYGYDAYSAYGFVAGAAAATVSTGIECDTGGPYATTCAGGTVTLDASRTTGPGPLDFTWRAVSAGVTIADPGAVVTNVDLSGRGPWAVRLTVTNGSEVVSCIALVEGRGGVVIPAGVSDDGVAPWLRVEKVTDDPTRLRLTVEDRGVGLGLYAGTIAATGIVAYDHQPIGCGLVATSIGPGVGELLALTDPGRGHYYLVSASNCAGEGTRGRRSDGAARPALPTDCGPWP